MKSDAGLKRLVEAELAWDPALNEASIGPTPEDIGRRIGEALQRQSTRAAQHMHIAVQGGTVDSWHERKAAHGAAWPAPGLRRVVDKLSVG